VDRLPELQLKGIPMRVRTVPRLVPLAVAGIALVVAGAPPSQAADPFVAGGRSTRTVALAPSEANLTIARASNLAKALGLPGVRSRTERLDDRFEHHLYDEVVSVDAQGRDVSIARFEPDGRVVMAIALGWQPGSGIMVGRDVAAARGLDVAGAAGLGVKGSPIVTASAGAGGWSVAWPRTVGGVPVPGDGVRVSLWTDGSFHALSRRERPLAAAPISRISADAARRAAASIVADRFAGGANAVRVVATELTWVAPNDTWTPDLPDAPAETLRLAWVVRFEARGALAERLRLIEYWIDAGSGSLLGGDLVE
jgi:hypothetical protein